MLALSVFICASLALAWCERCWWAQLQSHSLARWVAEHVGLPMLRVAVVLSFVILAYPRIFGLDETVPLSQLLSGERPAHWINAMFVLALLLPLLPGIQHLSEALLPLQGMLAVAMLFRWLGQALDQPALPWWPDAGTLVFTALWIATHLLIRRQLRQHGWEGRGHWLADALLLVMQLPILWVFGQQLGDSLPPRA